MEYPWKTLLFIGVVLVLLGILVMTLCNLRKNHLLKQMLIGRQVTVPRSIGQLWTEVGLGVILTGAVFFFSMLCFASELALRISFPIAYGASVLCGIGCFIRSHEGLNALGLTKDEGANPEPVAVFPEERRFLVILAFFSVALTVFLAGLLTLGWAASQFVIHNSLNP
jgi:xanthine/uracil/vitamin C permease (AzgA family)